MSRRWSSFVLASMALVAISHSIALAESLARSTGRVDTLDVLKRANQSTVELVASTGSGRYVGHSNGAGVVISPMATSSLPITSFAILTSSKSVPVMARFCPPRWSWRRKRSISL